MAERASEPVIPDNCRNCGESLCGIYCHACGESHRYFPRLELRAIVGDLVRALANHDTPALRTLGQLTSNPGRVGRDYLTGRHRPYIRPLTYAAAGFVFLALVNLGLVALHGPSELPELARLSGFAFSWGLAIDFLALPLFALCTYALFLGGPRLGGALGAPRQLEWIEHYVAALFAFGHATLLLGLAAPLLPYLGAYAPAAIVGGVTIYVSWMCVGVYRSPWWSTLPRVGLAFVAGVLLPTDLLGRWLVPQLFLP